MFYFLSTFGLFEDLSGILSYLMCFYCASDYLSIDHLSILEVNLGIIIYILTFVLCTESVIYLFKWNVETLPPYGFL